VPGRYLALSWLAAAGAAVVTVAVPLVGCGTDPVSTGATNSTHPGPQPGGRAEAETFARQVMTQLALPPRTQPAQPSALPASLRDPWAGPAGSAPAGSVDLGRVYAARQTPEDTEAFLLSHPPSGAGSPGTGQENGPHEITELYLYFQVSSLPDGINDAEVMMLMVPREAASTLLATYIHVSWFPSRTAAEHLDSADFDAVSVHALLLNRKPHNVERTFGSPADIAELAGLLNGLAAAPGTAHTCPASLASYQISFEPRTVQHAGVAVTTTGCNSVTVTTGGVPQPALLDPRNALAATAARMLGIDAS
jgi:hypothetical protein